ncbi:MAG TPA: YhjD/YihY/BrkB family envelope integrity protein [Nocardioidaceae bacterium]
MSGDDANGTQSEARLRSRLARAIDRSRRVALFLVDVVPGLRRLLAEVARNEIIDRSLVVAAQAMFSVTPLLIVVAAFSPRTFGDSLSESMANVMGVQQEDTTALQRAATVDQVRAQTGIVGVAIVLVSALSFARALQRMYERVWQQQHRGGVVGNRRCFFWLVSWIAYLEMIAVLSHVLPRGDLSTLRLVVQFVVSTAVWWWTMRMLLLGRVGWPNLLLGALLTSIGVLLLTRFSRLLMPAYVGSAVDQFGTLGVIFAISTWLLVFGGILVVAAIIGRVYTEELTIMQRFIRMFAKRTAPDSQPAGGA